MVKQDRVLQKLFVGQSSARFFFFLGFHYLNVERSKLGEKKIHASRTDDRVDG